MLNWLKLTNFSQHTDRTFVFSDGLNVMRGQNEAGKSKIISSLLYLWFGSGALDGTLADAVTYGMEEKTLKVEGSMTFDGIEYTMHRAKSGAQIKYGDQLVSGATECTRFMERLLGGKSDLVKKLIVAEQNSIRGILTSEDKAGALIENLAELDVVDELIEKIQNQLASGPTKSQELLVTELNGSTGSEPVKPSDAGLVEAQLLAAKADDAYNEAKAALQEPMQAAVEAEGCIARAEKQNEQRDAALARQEALQAVEFPAACEWTMSDYEAARKEEADVKYAEAIEKARGIQFKTLEASWEGTVETAQQFLKDREKMLESEQRIRSDLQVQIATKQATKINEGVCAFCQIDISQRPEVLEKNTAVDTEVKALQDTLAVCQKTVGAYQSDISAIKLILSTHQANLALAQGAATGGCWEPIPGRIPCAFKWIGPKVADNLSVSVASSTIQAALRKYDLDVAKYRAAQEDLAKLHIPEEVPFEAFSGWQLTVSTSENLKAGLKKLEQALAEANSNVKTVKAQYDGELSVYRLQVEQRKKDLARVAKARETLLEMEFNNQLIKDLREARADIRKKLWQSVTAAISVYFSRIRNVDTVVSVGEKGFLCNGKPAKGLSGSAQDMLGLAIRAALVKTFLPQATMMVADEPFAACDAARETAGIGVIASLGFDQTLLVTHSDLADAVAKTVVAV